MEQRRAKPDRASLQRQVSALKVIVAVLARRLGGAEQIAVEIEMSGGHTETARDLAIQLLRPKT